MSNERQETVSDNVSANHQFREVAKMIPHEEVDVSKMETATPTREKSSAVGNAAAMREALIKVRSAICHFARYQCQSLSWEKSNIQANCCDVLCSWRDLCDAKTAINAALSAPPRNCDIMDWRTAWAKWRTERHPQKPCGYADVVSGTEQFMDWYMSEAKGETK